MTVFQPLTIQGLGGVGKTQVALEYAHRFRADYDIIWWMDCGQAQYVDASLADLGQQLRELFGVAVPEEGGVTEVCQQVLQALSEGLPDKRWLLIYDNAEDVEQLRPLLPAGGGHVLITSRNERWQDVGTFLEVDKFRPQESVSHLRWRLPAITEADAGRIARVLQNMPLAVTAAGALLAFTGMSADDYLERLERQQTRTYPAGDPLAVYPPEVLKAWHLSLDELQNEVRRGGPAAWHLLGHGAADQPGPDQQRGHGGNAAGPGSDHLRAGHDRQAHPADRPARADQGRQQQPADPGAPGRPGRRQRSHVGRGDGGGPARRASAAGRRQAGRRRRRPADLAALPG